MSVIFTATMQVAGDESAAQVAFDAFRETKLPGDNDTILWNMRPAGEPMTYLVDVEVEVTDDEAQARQVFEGMVERTRPAENGIAFSDLTVVESAPVPSI